MTLAEPIAEKQKPGVARLAGVDLARGLAVFGMFTSHVGPAATSGDITGMLMDFASGRSSALFATLAGLSLAIISGRQEPATGLAGEQAAARRLHRRCHRVRLGVVAVLPAGPLEFLLHRATLPAQRIKARQD